MVRAAVITLALALARSLWTAQETRPSASLRDGQHDFDFEIDRWKTHLRRLDHPLSGSTTWSVYDGTSVVRAIPRGHRPPGQLDGFNS